MKDVLKYKIQDRKIYYDISGLLLDNGDFVFNQFCNIPEFGICEYAKFHVYYYNIDKPNKFSREEIKYGLIIHKFGFLPDLSTSFFNESNIKILNNNFKDKTKSDYSDKFCCDIYFDEKTSEHKIMLPLLRLSEEAIEYRFLDEHFELFTNVQQQIINADNKIYTHYEIERNNNYAR